MTVQGVNGVLQALLTEPTAEKPSRLKQPVKRKKAPCKLSATKARTGRPPQSMSHGTERQKVTFRIRPDLIEGYRDWSWDARMSVSQLVEAALDDYFTRRGR